MSSSASPDQLTGGQRTGRPVVAAQLEAELPTWSSEPRAGSSKPAWSKLARSPPKNCR